MMNEIIDTHEIKERSILFYIVPSTLMGIGLAAALIVAAPVGAAIATTGILFSIQS